jgi:Raf kinase inhibitor-like YbhB/YbcL family protein
MRTRFIITYVMRIMSPAFDDGGRVPPKFTCDGDDVNPELRFADVPGDTVSLVIMIDDPKSPSGNWLHWSLWNIDPRLHAVEEDCVPKGAVEGETDFSEIGYGGPCPSYGEHEYRFMVFALDVMLELPRGTQRHVLERAMEGHILASATMQAKYQRIKKEPRVAKMKINALVH